MVLLATLLAAPASHALDSAEWNEVCRFSDERLIEISGMTPSLLHENVLWVHNDSSDDARLYGINAVSCDVVAEVRLRGVRARDFEAIASSRDARGRPVLWVGDIGDNRDSWPFVTLHRIREPKKLGSTTRRTTSWKFTYPDRPHNAETLLAHGTSTWVATWQLASGGLYSVPRDESGGGDVQVAERVGDVGSLITDGALSPDGKSYVLRDYLDLHVYQGSPPGRRVARLALPNQTQGEAIAWSANGEYLYTASEGEDRLLRVEIPWWVRASLRPPDHLVAR